MNVLARQIRWLKQFSPKDSQLYPRMRLVWLTTQLAECNHRGRTDVFAQYEREFVDLCNTLLPEDAPLTCLASLHVAVAYMNNYDFQDAENAVKPWLRYSEAIPGRRYFGQVLSTMGQLYAFRNQNAQAIEMFDRALERFRLLSEPEERGREILQTTSYKVIAMMDSDPLPSTVREELEAHLGRTLADAATQFARSEEAGEKYAHHAFLRFLANGFDEKIAEEYVSQSANWKTGDRQHPWEMIQFYRALLTSDQTQRCRRLREAYEMVADCQGTLGTIACVILGGLFYYDSSCRDELAKKTQSVVDTMPYLGAQRVEALQKQLTNPVEPLVLAKILLPFNFR